MPEDNKIRYIHDKEAHNLTAPEIIVPVLMDVLKPQSVVDVGCGIGTFLHVFIKSGVNDVLGYDGSWVNPDQLSQYLSPAFFREVDLEKSLSPERRFDLALCLEVAEHLHPENADNLVETLTSLSSKILFSAAVPGQIGQNHINEQWPEYWQEQFSRFGYGFHDVLRPVFWNVRQVPRWYKQNMFMVVKAGEENSLNGFEKYFDATVKTYVHPEYFELRVADLENLQKDMESLKKHLRDVKAGSEPVTLYIKMILKALLKRLGLYRN
jgi:SAM-dependent methyltransferase